MTVLIATFQTVEVPSSTPLAVVGVHSGDLSLYPEGVGRGPVITMTVRDWETLKLAADTALKIDRLNREAARRGADD